MKRNKTTHPNQKSQVLSSVKQPFIEHVYELRRRLFYIALSIGIFGTAGYLVQQSIVGNLIRPAHGQQFIYTSPIGGVDFLFRVCLYLAVIVSIPVIVYNALRFVQPLISESSVRFIVIGSIASGILAAAGLAFGYFVGLPTALHFLLHQFITPDIRAMITIQSYLHFVMVYMVGSALLFQMPLILLLINKIKPLKPKRLLHHERWVILGAFVMSGLMNPTPHLFDQLLVAGPLILMYQLSIALIALINRGHAKAVSQTYQADVQDSQTAQRGQVKSLDFIPLAAPQMLQGYQRTLVAPQPLSTNRKYIDGFVRPG